MNEKINKHLCFICERSWPLFTDKNVNGIGGVETRSVKLAEMMAIYFKKVTFAIRRGEYNIINDHGLNIVLYEPNIISNSYNYELAIINADIYIVFESYGITADAVRTCNIIGKTVIFWAANNNNFNENYKLDNYEGIYLGFIIGREAAYCLYMSNYILCQTNDQKKLLFKNHKLTSKVIYNPIKIESKTIDKKITSNNKNILWIGRTENFKKRPDILIDIAKRLPNFNFIAILNNTDDIMYNKIINNAPNNLKIIDYIPHDKINEIFFNCTIFLSTSQKDNEGFSNVFLQASVNGLVIISLEFDPDGIFTKHKCGICCENDLNKVIIEINNISNNEKRRNKIINNAFKYINKYHSEDVISKQMVNYFDKIPLNKKLKNKWWNYSYDRIIIQQKEEYKNIIEKSNQLSIQLNNINDEIKNIYNRNIILENELKSIKQSKSWRITKPLRFLKHYLH